jgi:hypothetical protein
MNSVRTSHRFGAKQTNGAAIAASRWKKSFAFVRFVENGFDLAKTKVLHPSIYAGAKIGNAFLF